MQAKIFDRTIVKETLMTNKVILEDDEIMAREPDLVRLRQAYALLQTDSSHAIEELQKMASAGSVMSALYLSECFGKEPYIDLKKAEKWLKMAYGQGSARGLFCLAAHYVKIENYAEAEKIYLDGVEKNDGPSIYYLAKLYLKTNRYSIASPEVKNLFERAAALGQAKAMRDVWLLYIKGAFGIWNIPKGVFLLISYIFRVFRGAVGQRSDVYGPSDRRLW
jgi:tetratricopeptide (TPR) repeat protein